MSPTDFTDFPSDPSELGHLMADDCRERATNLANDRIDEAVERHQNAKHAPHEAYRAKAFALAAARQIARELGRSADEAGTGRLAADLAKGGEA